MTVRVQCWSGPRNVSTALMYSWNHRSDTTAVDEPLYAAYLARFDRGHPMTAEVIASQSTDPDEVIEQVILGPCDTPVLFCKQMAHHLRGLRTDFLARTENVLLTRDPADMLRSLAVQLPTCDLDDTGLVEQVAVLDAILAAGGTPVVVESRSLLTDPVGVLTEVCERVGVPFDEAMLSWPAGPKAIDGVWAPAWYRSVHASTGWGSPHPTTGELPDRVRPVLDQAMPLYERLLAHAVGQP